MTEAGESGTAVHLPLNHLRLDAYTLGPFGTITVSPTDWPVTGRLTARGTSVRIADDVELSGQDRLATLTAHTGLDRCILGVRAPSIMIGHEIDITVTAAIRRIADQ